MLAHPTLDHLNALGLYGLAKGFKELEHKAEARSLDHAEWLGLLLEYELTLRRQKQFETRARVARLRHPAIGPRHDAMKPICMAKVGSLNLQRDNNGGPRYGAIESALRPPLPTATPSLRDNPTLLLSIGTQKGTPIGVQKGPLSWRMRNDRAESGRCAGQSRPKPRGETIAWSSVRSRSQIACNASAVALSCRFSGRASSQAA